MSVTVAPDALPAGPPGLHDQIDLCLDAISYAHYVLGSMGRFVTGYDPKADVGYGWGSSAPDKANSASSPSPNFARLTPTSGSSTRQARTS